MLELNRYGVHHRLVPGADERGTHSLSATSIHFAAARRSSTASSGDGSLSNALAWHLVNLENFSQRPRLFLRIQRLRPTGVVSAGPVASAWAPVSSRSASSAAPVSVRASLTRRDEVRKVRVGDIADPAGQVCCICRGQGVAVKLAVRIAGHPPKMGNDRRAGRQRAPTDRVLS